MEPKIKMSSLEDSDNDAKEMVNPVVYTLDAGICNQIHNKVKQPYQSTDQINQSSDLKSRIIAVK